MKPSDLQPEAQVTTWALYWHLKWEGGVLWD